MAIFEESYSLKEKSRKRPVVHYDSPSSSSSTEIRNQDYENIKKLSQLDAGLAVDVHSKYNYLSTKNNHINRLSNNDKNHPNKNAANLLLSNDQPFDNDDGQLSDEEENRSSENDGNHSLENGSEYSSKNPSDGKNEVLSEDNVNYLSEGDGNNKNFPNGNNGESFSI